MRLVYLEFVNLAKSRRTLYNKYIYVKQTNKVSHKVRIFGNKQM